MNVGQPESVDSGRQPAGEAPEAHELSPRSVGRGLVWAVAAATLPPLYTFVTSIAMARFLGTDGLGRLVFISFVSTTLSIFLVAGLPRSLMRYIGEALGSGTAGRIRPLLRSIALPITLVAVTGFSICTAVGLRGAEPKYAWIFAGIACGGAVLHAIPSSILVGLHQWREAFVVGISLGAVGMVARVLILFGGGGITELIAVDAAIISLNVLGTSFLALRAMRKMLPPPEPLGDLARQVWRFGAIASIAVVINYVVFRRTEIFFLEHSSTGTQIALYSVPFSLVEVFVLMPRFIGQVVTPSVATMFGAGDMVRIGSSYGRAVRVVLPAGFFAATAAAILGPLFITLAYGANFAQAGSVLAILALTLPLVPLMTLSSSVLVGIGRQWVPTAIFAVAAVVNIALDVILIPRYDAIGAAIANSGGQIVGSIPLAMYTATCIGSVSLRAGRLVRGGIAALLAGLAAEVLVRLLPPMAALPIGAAAFLLVALMSALFLRVIDRDDAAWLITLMPHRLVRSVARAARVLRLPSPVAP